MIGQRIPLFSKGKILTGEMLQVMSDYAITAHESTYLGYSDGIIKGCNITVSDNILMVNPGMILYGGHLYLITKVIEIPYEPKNKWVALRIEFEEELVTNSFLVREINIKFSQELESDKHCIELCRFNLREGAKLRTKYQDFADRNTEYDTLNTIYATYSAWKRPTLDYDILYHFASEAVKISSISDKNIQFCQQIFAANGSSVNRNLIEMYISQHKQARWREYSNIEIFANLNKILKEIQNDIEEEQSPVRKRHKVILA